ncbi:unnamed protein product, partial [Amoebophrya sp. A25]
KKGRDKLPLVLDAELVNSGSEHLNDDPALHQHLHATVFEEVLEKEEESGGNGARRRRSRRLPALSYWRYLNLSGDSQLILEYMHRLVPRAGSGKASLELGRDLKSSWRNGLKRRLGILKEEREATGARVDPDMHAEEYLVQCPMP